MNIIFCAVGHMTTPNVTRMCFWGGAKKSKKQKKVATRPADSLTWI